MYTEVVLNPYGVFGYDYYVKLCDNVFRYNIPACGKDINFSRYIYDIMRHKKLVTIDCWEYNYHFKSSQNFKFYVDKKFYELYEMIRSNINIEPESSFISYKKFTDKFINESFSRFINSDTIKYSINELFNYYLEKCLIMCENNIKNGKYITNSNLNMEYRHGRFESKNSMIRIVKIIIFTELIKHIKVCLWAYVNNYNIQVID